jgi:hypothetical protein
MTFGGSNCPPSWCAISKLFADLANELTDTQNWNPNDLQWAHQHLIPSPTLLDDDIEFARTADCMMLPEPRPHGSNDIFIDDIISVFLGKPEYIATGVTAAPLAVDILSRPYDPTDQPRREHMLALSKLAAEGGPREIQTISGWTVNTRTLTINLPTEKYLAWKEDIELLIKVGSTKHETLEALVVD